MKSIILVVVLSLIFSSSSFANGNGLCRGENANLSCLKEYFFELYSTNYQLFWDILHNAVKKLQDNESLSDIESFMEMASVIQGNAEVSEFFNEVVEKYFVSNPNIWLDALVNLNRKSKEDFIDRLRQPIFLPKVQIDKIIFKYKELKKYKEIIELYYETGNNAK